MNALRYSFISFTFAILLFMSGCLGKEPTMTGYILEVEKDKILVAENISFEQYENLKHKTNRELFKEQISLIYLSYDDASSLRVGNKVDVWIDGDIALSNPAQAEAKKIVVKE
ncbi:DUF3221 domain-containing protein [Bacillus sp. 1P06AnD]|uniref:DUF3221 domain-containing protein n=1 Tax=Bacillus sp. 1P06AnD TaxID=3132208 RepID=UPI00399EEC3E